MQSLPDSKRIVISGMGAITPIGNGISRFNEALQNGRGGAATITHFDASALATQFACEVKDFDPRDYMDAKQAQRFDPFCQFALAAAREAIGDAGLDPAALSASQRDRIGVIFGSGIGGIQLLEQQTRRLHDKGPRAVSPFLVPMMIGNMAPGVIAMEFGLRGPNHGVVSACASANHAFGDALAVLRAGEADAIICGGAEAPITELAMAGFSRMQALSTRNDDPARASRPFDRDRDGFVSGEGAAALVLETLEHARKRNAPILAEVVGYGASADAYHYAAPDPEAGGIRLSMRRALNAAGLSPADIDYINLHATSTPLGDRAESKGIAELFGERSKQPHMSSTKSMTGHLLGAAGAIEAVACILALRHGYIPPTINLDNPDEDTEFEFTAKTMRKADVNVAMSNAFGFGGHNTTVIFRQFK